MQATSEKIILNSGRNVTKYILKNHKGMEVEVISIGATLTKITAPDKDGNYENVILGWQDLNVYEQNPGNFGAIIGRIAGRVFKGTVTIADNAVRSFAPETVIDVRHVCLDVCGYAEGVQDVMPVEFVYVLA